MNRSNEFLFLLFLALVLYVVVAFFYFIFIKRKVYKIAELDERHTSVILTRTLRVFWYWLSDPIYKILLFFKVSPNVLTVMAAFISLIAAIVIARGEIVWGSWILAFASTFDMLDGQLARASGRIIKRGEFLDSCCDRLSDGVVFVGIMYHYRNDAVFFIITGIILITSFAVSYFKARAKSLGVENESGMMQRPERLWVLCCSGILSGLFPNDLLFKFALVFLVVTVPPSALMRLLSGYMALSVSEKKAKNDKAFEVLRYKEKS